VTNPTPSAISQESQSLKNEIQDFESRLQTLQGKQDSWNRWYMRLAVLAVLVGSALGTVSWLFQKKANKLDIDARPLRAQVSSKNERLRQISELQISQAQGLAEDARTSAGDAQARAETIAGENIKLKASLDKEVRDSEGRAEELRKQNLATETRLTEANGRIEEEKAKRLQLEIFSNPRAIVIRGNGKGTNLDVLREFSGMKVYVRYFPGDAEARRATKYILGALQQAGFTNIEVHPFPEAEADHFDGVNIGTSRPIVEHPGSGEDFEKSERGEHLLLVFGKFFADEGWVSGREWAERGELKENEFRITVGFKPNPPPEFRDLEAREIELMKRLPLPPLIPPK
jgi:hypothetical protein